MGKRQRDESRHEPGKRHTTSGFAKRGDAEDVFGPDVTYRPGRGWTPAKKAGR